MMDQEVNLLGESRARRPWLAPAVIDLDLFFHRVLSSPCQSLTYLPQSLDSALLHCSKRRWCRCIETKILERAKALGFLSTSTDDHFLKFCHTYHAE
jgi:hypothetical protein